MYPIANKLSINLVSESVVSALEEILRLIHRKAEELLRDPHSIIATPGSTDNRAYIVERKMFAKPCFVLLAKNRKATCDDCPGWKSLKVCCHAVAAAEKSGRLFQYVKWLKEKGPSRMNITSYVTCDSGNGTGKKGGKLSTARCKGGRTGKTPPAKNIVDRPLPAPLARVTPTTVPFTAYTTVPLATIDTHVPTIDDYRATIDPFFSMINPYPAIIQRFRSAIDTCRATIDDSHATIDPYYATIFLFLATINSYGAAMDAYHATACLSLATISTHVFSNILWGEYFKLNVPKSCSRNIYGQPPAILSFVGTFVLWLLPGIKTRWHDSSSSTRPGYHFANAKTILLANR